MHQKSLATRPRYQPEKSETHRLSLLSTSQVPLYPFPTKPPVFDSRLHGLLRLRDEYCEIHFGQMNIGMIVILSGFSLSLTRWRVGICEQDGWHHGKIWPKQDDNRNM
jgi:hypothetical protein